MKNGIIDLPGTGLQIECNPMADKPCSCRMRFFERAANEIFQREDLVDEAGYDFNPFLTRMEAVADRLGGEVVQPPEFSPHDPDLVY